MLTRLTDRIDVDPDGGEMVVKRYGMWGTTTEIEVRKRKYVMVFPNKKEKTFKRLIDAELYLKEKLDYK